MTTTAFLVTSGSYSDYRVERVYSTREKAEQAIALSSDPVYYDIEEYELDAPVVAPDKPGWDWYRVSLSVSYVKEINDTTYAYKLRRDVGGGYADYTTIDTEGKGKFIEWHNFKGITRYVVGYVFITDVYADTKERAIKVANERRMMAVANGELQAALGVWQPTSP